MRAIDYALREAWASLWRSGRSTVFAVLAITLAAVVLGALLLGTWNVDRLLSQLSTASEFSVFLQDDATSEERGAIEAALDESGVAAGREYVSKAQALTRFRSEFADLASLTDDLDDNPFPASLEVRVRPEAEQSGQADALVKRIAGMPGVADVRYDREWLARLRFVRGDQRQLVRVRKGLQGPEHFVPLVQLDQFAALVGVLVVDLEVPGELLGRLGLADSAQPEAEFGKEVVRDRQRP